ncbi:MAG: hypothetical protein ABIH66_09725, partial [bacterium]
MVKKTCKTLFFLALMLGLSCPSFAKTVTIVHDADAEQCLKHGVAYLQRVIEEKGLDASVQTELPAEDGAVIVVADLGKNEEMKKEFAAAGADIPEKAEAFVIRTEENRVFAGGTDAVGAMYAAYEIAEQIEMMESPENIAANIEPGTRVPSMEIRAVNPFFHVEAFNDPESWYFDEKFWETYLDELSYDRYNLLDIHAMYGLISTFFPNCYLYMLKSDKFPQVGIDAEEAK